VASGKGRRVETGAWKLRWRGNESGALLEGVWKALEVCRGEITAGPPLIRHLTVQLNLSRAGLVRF